MVGFKNEDPKSELPIVTVHSLIFTSDAWLKGSKSTWWAGFSTKAALAEIGNEEDGDHGVYRGLGMVGHTRATGGRSWDLVFSFVAWVRTSEESWSF